MITIDGKRIKILDEDKNIIDVADRAKVGIPAPCYRTKKSNGCCYACIVEVDGKNEYACGTEARDGMVVVVRRDDLEVLRRENIRKYKEGMKDGSNPSSCCRYNEKEN